MMGCPEVELQYYEQVFGAGVVLGGLTVFGVMLLWLGIDWLRGNRRALP